jgi:hypothetical protein
MATIKIFNNATRYEVTALCEFALWEYLWFAFGREVKLLPERELESDVFRRDIANENSNCLGYVTWL